MKRLYWKTLVTFCQQYVNWCAKVTEIKYKTNYHCVNHGEECRQKNISGPQQFPNHGKTINPSLTCKFNYVRIYNESNSLSCLQSMVTHVRQNRIFFKSIVPLGTIQHKVKKLFLTYKWHFQKYYRSVLHWPNWIEQKILKCNSLIWIIKYAFWNLCHIFQRQILIYNLLTWITI